MFGFPLCFSDTLVEYQKIIYFYDYFLEDLLFLVHFGNCLDDLDGKLLVALIDEVGVVVESVVG